jgi:serine/threonine-protein kinase RsbW
MKQISKLRFKAVLENVSTAIDCVAKSAQEAGLDEGVLYQLQLAVDEACANVIHHAYKGMEPGDIEVSCSLDDQRLVIRVRDWGKSFAPDQVPEPDVDAPLEERSLGGLGLFLIRQCMDQVEFTFSSDLGNELTMTKRLQGAESSCQTPN